MQLLSERREKLQKAGQHPGIGDQQPVLSLEQAKGGAIVVVSLARPFALPYGRIAGDGGAVESGGGAVEPFMQCGVWRALVE